MLRFLRSQKNTDSRTENIEPWNLPYELNATTQDIFYCFRLLLGRNPHREEWTGHCTRAGQKLDSVVSTYLQSLEFDRRNLMARDYMGALELITIEDFKIFAAADDLAVGKCIQQGSYEPDVTNVFRKFVKPGMNVIDLGANIGYFTMLSATLVGATGTVLAVEPNHRNVKLMEASRRVNNFENITIAQVAAGRETGILVLNPSHSNGLTSDLSANINAVLGAETVPSIRVEALVPQERRIDFIKVDVEGAEFNALFGCYEIIKRDRPVIVSEFSPDLMPGISHVTGPEYLKWLADLGYQLGVVEKEDGSISDFGTNLDAIMAVYHARATNHIDIAATPY